METVLFENGSEQVVNYHNGRTYVNGAGYQFEVISLVDNNFMTTGEVRKETEEFLTDYFTKQELDDDEKEIFLNEIIQKHIHERDDDWLKEQFEDYEDWEMQDNYYNDVSLSEIVNTIYDVFAYINTRAKIEVKTNEYLGRYGSSMLAKVDDMYYLFFE